MLPQYQEAFAAEKVFGDPYRADNLLSFFNAMKLDEREKFPEAEMSFLLSHGFPDAYVPAHWGGGFTSSEGFLALGRVLARRNMSVAVSYSTMLWSMLVWVGGTPTQQERVARWVMKLGMFPCLAYSEANHGADLSANELTAHKTEDGGYILNGEKWPINRATRSDFLVLLARTKDSQDLRNHSLFVVNKRELECRQYYHLPGVKTHGLHGCDISGIGFRNCYIPAESRIGAEGHGLELALKGFQITRTFCTALSLGVGDSALRLVMDFSRDRKLYGTTVSHLPQVRDTLANAFVSLLAAEVVSIVSARGLHFFPEQFSSWSSIAKVQATHLVDYANQQLSTILGARYYMREQHAEGMFQKILRDGAIVSVFDGSTPVCLDSLATLLPTFAKARAAGVEPVDTAALYDMAQDVQPLSFKSISLFGRGRDAVMESLPELLEHLSILSPSEDLSASSLAELVRLSTELMREMEQLDRDILEEPPKQGFNSARQFALAEQYIAIHSSIAAIGFWIYNRDKLGNFFASGVWLRAILLRRGNHQFHAGELPKQVIEPLYAQLEQLHQERFMFSAIHWPLAAHQAEQIQPQSNKETFNEHHYA